VSFRNGLKLILLLIIDNQCDVQEWAEDVALADFTVEN